ncbi:MAG: hypothetical protein JOZ24_02165 [Candidatus Eremiobacteraeota bacterium]|nr:hypothetical protein [Candidatus Eremiobacteraeota bacterium]
MTDAPRSQTALPSLEPAATIDDVLARIDAVVQWSIAGASRLGYFAALYKRITRAVKAGIAAGRFADGARMERLDVAFANRYLDALNGYFARTAQPAASACWRVAFDGASLSGPGVVQHMLAGVNAHIGLDLAIAAVQIARPAPLSDLHSDFDEINVILAEQLGAVLDEIDRISPVLADLYDVFKKYELTTLADGLVVIRDDAWRFAEVLALEPELIRSPTIAGRDVLTAAAGMNVLHPPPPVGAVAAGITAREATDISSNIRILDDIASSG